MGGNLYVILTMVPLALLLLPSPCASTSALRRADFPPSFVFGAGTSAYQVEGAAHEDGRGVSIWDTFTHAGKTIDGSTADVSADGYHHYKEDVKLMAETGLEGYRFSISWPRILPNGRGPVNPKAIDFYNNLIDELLSHEIQPHATLFHFDLPQVLEDEYGGWLSPKIIDDFTAYANVCFAEFGDRVSIWTTINEPNILSIGSYDSGVFPPCRCSYPFGPANCSAGNSTAEPYIALHNFLLAHSSAVDLYRTNYKPVQRGSVGINIFAFGFYPNSNSTVDIEACWMASEFFYGWVVNPVLFGDYPEVIKENVGSKLPTFSERQAEMLRGSIDFLGVNFYYSQYVSGRPETYGEGARDFFGDMPVLLSDIKTPTQDEKISPPASNPLNPNGMENLLLSLKNSYGDLPIYIHENGAGTPFNVTIDDPDRIDAISNSIAGILSAIRRGSNCRGYFVWSFLDVFEILSGMTRRYGLYYVDFEDDNRRRQPKLSALWYRDFLKKPDNLKTF